MAKTEARRENKLTAAVRTETGKGASRRARRAGQIHAVLTLDIDGKEQLALTKSLEIHPIRRNIQHADLLVVRRGEKVTVEVNVIVEGEAIPGTMVTQDANTVEIEADVQAIPDQLTVSVEGADIGTQFAAGSI